MKIHLITMTPHGDYNIGKPCSISSAQSAWTVSIPHYLLLLFFAISIETFFNGRTQWKNQPFLITQESLSLTANMSAVYKVSCNSFKPVQGHLLTTTQLLKYKGSPPNSYLGKLFAGLLDSSGIHCAIVDC